MAVGGGAGGAGRGRPAATGALGRRGGGKGNHRSAHESLAARGGARRILHHSRRDGRRLAAQKRRPHRGAERDLPAPRLRHRRRRQGRIRLPVPRQPLRRRRQLHQRPLAAPDGPSARPRRGKPPAGAGLALRHRHQSAEGDLKPAFLGHWLDENVPGGARWAYVFGSALVFLLLAQLASGLALAMSYSASVPAAWASVAQIVQSRLGHLLRGLHAQGATFLLAVAGLHLLQTALYGAYRKPREATWWLGLVLLALLLLFCLTGSLLPWDERGYWATRVPAGIVGPAPLV